MYSCSAYGINNFAIFAYYCLEMELIYQNELGSSINRLEYDRKRKTVWVISKGMFFDKIALEASKKLMEFATTTPVVAIVFDASEMKGTFSKLMGFFKDEFSPHMEARGCLYVATVFAGNTFAIFTMQQLLKLIRTKAEIKIFKTVDQAREWINQKLTAQNQLEEDNKK